MLYGLRVLLSVIDDVNSGQLSREDAFKRIKEIKWVGGLMANHLFAVGVLRGLIAKHELLAFPEVASTLCSVVKKRLFENHDGMTDERIRKATARVSEKLGLNLLGGEHGLCEAMRALKESRPGNDGFHRDQDFVWISMECECEESIINEVTKGKTIKYRKEEDDLSAIHNLRRDDSIKRKHEWWIPEPNRNACLAHFVKECISNGSNPMEVVHPSAVGKDKSSREEELVLWNKYITTPSNMILVESLPHNLRSIKKGAQSTLQLSKTKDERRKRKGSDNVQRKAIKRTKNGKVKDEAIIGNDDEKTDSMTTCADGINNEATHFVKVCLISDARKAWQEVYGQQLPPLNVFGGNYNNIGMVWRCALSVPNRTEPFYTKTEYPPSVQDECAKALPNGEGIAFIKQSTAKHAMLWWIICTVPSKGGITKWANQLLGQNRKVVILANNQVWCTLLKDNIGSICVEYKGRRSVLA
jgi:hypothetical protein